MLRQLLQLKFEFRSLVAREPRLALLYQPFVWRRQYSLRRSNDVRECRVDPDTDLVIDGFQGTANSFATEAFRSSQTRPVRLAHHLHSPAQIVKAVHLGLPVLVTIREPKDAVLSLISRWPYLSVQQALRGYIGFYGKIEPCVRSILVSSFEQTIQHFDEVILKINRKFETSFDIFECTKGAMLSARGPVKHAMIRQAIKTQKAKSFGWNESRRLLANAEQLYERLTAVNMSHTPIEGVSLQTSERESG